ncbi:hypothetical protein [Hymenobacter crusticola]|uniref:hypothetical protein n=1 Tax=Hymenobacter crusticola TaxID=1770526 RepID=UPI000A3B2CD3|nr:hypothetical protein [Hymenobacter crusticola]
MKPSEIIPRQTRVIYVLMVVVAVLALFWATRENTIHSETDEQRAQQHHIARRDTAGKSVITVQNRKK